MCSGVKAGVLLERVGGRCVRGRVSAEQQVWRHLPGALQEELRGFGKCQWYEDGHNADLKQRVKDFAQEFFQAGKEATLVRPLALRLGYLLRSGAEVWETPPGGLDLLAWEGEAGGLELLHPCAERPGLSKYQALCAEGAEFDRYRAAFLCAGGGSRVK